MELLDRYLAEIQRNLPQAAQRTDVVAEIADELQSQIEEREAELGRALSSDEEADLLRKYGHPRVVASRYAKMQYLIGPDVLPFYWYTLKMVLAIVLGVELFGSAVAALVNHRVSIFWNGVGAMWTTPVWVFGVVTLVFALIEYFSKNDVLHAMRVDRWDPRKLPRVEATEYVSRFKSGFEFFANVTFLFVLLDIAGARHGFLQFAAGAAGSITSPIVLTAAWQPAYVATIIGCSVIAIGAFITYVGPYLAKVRLLAHAIGNSLVAVGAALTLRNGTLLSAAPSAVPPDQLLALNAMLSISLLVVIIAAAIAAAVALWKLIMAQEQPSRRTAAV